MDWVAGGEGQDVPLGVFEGRGLNTEAQQKPEHRLWLPAHLVSAEWRGREKASLGAEGSSLCIYWTGQL